VREEVAADEVAHKGLVDWHIVEAEVVDVLGQRQLGDGDLIFDRSRLLLGDLRGQQIADDALRLVLALHRHGDDLVECRLHAVKLQLRHGSQDFGTFHQWVLLRLSYRAQSAAGACRSRNASGVMIVIGGSGSRRRARMLRTTSAEWTPSCSASRPAASTAGSPSLSTAARMVTTCRWPSAGPVSLRRMRSSPDGRIQFLNGAPLRNALGLRA